MHTFFRRATAAVFLGAVLVSAPISAAKRHGNRAPSSAPRDSLQRILTAENQRNGKDPYLASAIHHPTAAVRQAALYAVARIGDPSLVGEISEQLNHKRGPSKPEAIFALGLLSDDSALTITVQHLAMQQDPAALAELYATIGRAGGEKNMPLFAAALQNSANPKVLEGACYGLGLLWAKDSESWALPGGLIANILQRARQNDQLALACGFALSRFKGLSSQIPPTEAVKTAEMTKSKEAQVFFVRVLGKIGTASASTYLIQKAAPFMPMAMRIEALKALGQHAPSKPILAAMRSALDSPHTPVIYQALDSLQNYGVDARDVSPNILELYKKLPSNWIQGKALRAGMATDSTLWKPVVLKEINNPKSDIRPAAAGALALLPNAEDAPLIAVLLGESNAKVPLDVLENMVSWPEEAFTEPIQTALKALLEKKDPALSAGVATLVERFKWKSFGAPLVSAYSGLSKPDLVESKVAILTALASLGDGSYVSLFETALKDTEKQVSLAGADALRDVAKRDESAQVPLNSRSAPFPFSMPEIDDALSTQVVLRTTRGEIRMRLVKDAPLNALNFVRLVRKKFYDGLIFHRVVPNFVAQGGDPRGDGFGGPGYVVRDEVAPRQHVRGTVGLATSGKDTGGSQFFINLASNFHLDGRYTIFAEVTRGMDVADKLEAGDRILSAKAIR